MPGDRGSSDLDPDRFDADDRFVRGLARRLVEDEHLAEDLAQETWLAAARHSVASVFTQRAWLGTVARNFAFQATRSKVRRLARERQAARSIVVDGSDEAPLEERTRTRLLAALAALDEPYRTVIRLRFFEDLPPTAIAERLAVPVETVRTRLKRALARIRARIAG